MAKIIIGVDVGGTNIKLGVVGTSGKILKKSYLSTKCFINSKALLINHLVEAVYNLFNSKKIIKKEVLGIGIGLPGLVDTQRGVVYFLPNIPGWYDVPLKKIIEHKLGIPTFIDNDVNLITMGEWQYGSGKGIENLVCLTLGTGVGSGLIINNQIYRGEGFSAGELGHIPLNEQGPRCNCGSFACLETYVGNSILLKRAKRIFKEKNISLEDVTDLALKGDSKAIEFWEEVALHIGNSLISVVNLLNPRRIIIGGGVANAEKFLFKTIEATIKLRAMKIPSKMVKVVKAKLGDNAGIIGTQVLVKNAISSIK